MKLSVMASAVVAASILIGSGCSAENGSAVPEKVASQEKRKAAAITYQRVVIDTDQGGFWFQPARCSIHEEDGAQHFDVRGAGKSPDGKPVYVTMEGADQGPQADTDVRIHIGVDAPFKHGDPVWISNNGYSHSFEIPSSKVDIDGSVLTFIGVEFGGDGSDRLEVNRPIRVDCSR